MDNYKLQPTWKILAVKCSSNPLAENTALMGIMMVNFVALILAIQVMSSSGNIDVHFGHD